jgi:2-hydroxy-3-keto-5-methylthiopentenyl-1-phosphate phosphatase
MWNSVHMTWDAAMELLQDNSKLDSEFDSFYQYCNDRNRSHIPITVLSSGLTAYVKKCMVGYNVDILANDINIHADNNWEIIYR